MSKYFLFIRSNLRRSKGQVIVIAILVFLVAVMLNLWLMLSMDYKQNFDRCHDRLNAEHVTFAIADDSARTRGRITDIIQKDDRTTEFSAGNAMLMAGSLPYNNGETNSNFIFLEKEAALSRSVGKIEITEDSSYTSGIYLPMLYKTGDMEAGKTVRLSISGAEAEFTICGFFNSTMAGSHNCEMIELILTEDVYEDFKKTGYAPAATLFSVRITDKDASENYEAMLNKEASGICPNVFTISNSYSLVTSSRYISQMICSGVISTMAFLVLLIALIVMVSNITNYIQSNMKKIGTMKAVGYTGKQLVHSLILQFSGIILITAVIGVGASYCLFPSINAMMAAQTGIPYAVHFLPLPAALTLIILESVTALAVWRACRKIRQIDPVPALRQGIQTHNFRRNPVPLEKTGAPLHLALALKTTFTRVKQNITVCITMLLLSLIVVFSGLMIENMIADSTSFVNLIAGETADTCINIRAECEQDFLRKMEADERVEKIYLYHSESVRHSENAELTVNICSDFAEVNNPDVCFQGRFPKYDNEIAIARKYAKENNLILGDEITLTANGQEAVYIITGYTQVSNSLGKDCLLTRAGYARLGELQNLSYYLNLRDGVDIASFNSVVSEKFPTNLTIDIDSVLTGSMDVYVSMMTIIVITVILLSVVIIAFVLYLLVRMLLSEKKQEYGILKALGFTTKQLIVQTALCFMPTAILSTAVGLLASCLIINPLLSVFLSGIGIVRCTFTIPAGFTILAGTGLIALTFLFACCMSLRIKKIVPRELLTDE